MMMEAVILVMISPQLTGSASNELLIIMEKTCTVARDSRGCGDDEVDYDDGTSEPQLLVNHWWL